MVAYFARLSTVAASVKRRPSGRLPSNSLCPERSCHRVPSCYLSCVDSVSSGRPGKALHIPAVSRTGAPIRYAFQSIGVYAAHPCQPCIWIKGYVGDAWMLVGGHRAGWSPGCEFQLKLFECGLGSPDTALWCSGNVRVRSTMSQIITSGCTFGLRSVVFSPRAV